MSTRRKGACRASLLAVLWCGLSAASAADPISGPPEFKRDTVAVYRVPAAGQLLVKVPDGVSVVKTPEAWYVAGKPGFYKWEGYWIDFDARKADVVQFDFRITGDADPTPPGPTPDPPGPNPPGPAPIPKDGLHVLIVFEQADAAKLTRDQLNTIYGQEFYDYLNARCPLGPDGKKRTWRIFDKDVGVAGDDPVWEAAMKRPRAELPWLIVSTGKAGYEGPLPKTKDEIMALVKKYGG